MSEVEGYLQDEWYVVRHSGEMPEVAYHSSVYFLTKDEEGPQLALSENEHMFLREAAAERYKEIVLRDILPENRGSAAYRGVQRSIYNFRRFRQFCLREQFDMGHFPEKVAFSLRSFLDVLAEEQAAGAKTTALNCTFEELSSFAEEVGLARDTLPKDLAAICSGGR